MKRRSMLLMVILILVSTCISCSTIKAKFILGDGGKTEQSNSEVIYETKDNKIDQDEIQINNSDEKFKITLYLDKETYTSKEAISCYATVEYIGEEDSITVYSSVPLVGFSLKDDTYFDGTYVSNDVLVTTTFKQGEVLKYKFSKSGGWSADDPNAKFYEKYYKEPEFILPKGNYKLSAKMNCSMDGENILNSKYDIEISTNIRVKK